jgi:hypothetical protein
MQILARVAVIRSRRYRRREKGIGGKCSAITTHFEPQDPRFQDLMGRMNFQGMAHASVRYLWTQ